MEQALKYVDEITRQIYDVEAQIASYDIGGSERDRLRLRLERLRAELRRAELRRFGDSCGELGGDE